MVEEYIKYFLEKTHMKYLYLQYVYFSRYQSY